MSEREEFAAWWDRNPGYRYEDRYQYAGAAWQDCAALKDARIAELESRVENQIKAIEKGNTCSEAMEARKDARIKELETALDTCAKKFEEYTLYHWENQKPVKAKANKELANMCWDALKGKS